MKAIEQEESEGGGVPGIACRLDHAEGARAVGAHAAQLAIEITRAQRKLRQSLGNRRVFVGPVETTAREQAHLAIINASGHAVAVELNLVQPLLALRRFLHEL